MFAGKLDYNTLWNGDDGGAVVVLETRRIKVAAGGVYSALAMPASKPASRPDVLLKHIHSWSNDEYRDAVGESLKSLSTQH